MVGIGKRKKGLIGVDLSHETLTVAQLARRSQGTALLEGRRVARPPDVAPGSPQWQRWVIDAMGRARRHSGFSGKDVIAALPASDVFIDHIECPRTSEGNIEEAIFAKIKSKVPFSRVRKDVAIKYIPTEQDHLMVFVTEHAVVDRHLAIYEHAGLRIKTIGMWPLALATCCAMFFSRRRDEHDAVVMLVDIQRECTNLAVTRNRNPLFARSVRMGARQLNDESTVHRLGEALDAARREMSMLYKDVRPERLVFLTGEAFDKEVCRSLARQLETRAQLGDCLESVEMGPDKRADLAGGGAEESWALAFGLSLCSG
ncbi:MAG: pilus assembly protein PilM [Sedimentisphaerales bacterium]|nr:pilus assembly protein PilM [Sedimentisphaerales bacterium]